MPKVVGLVSDECDACAAFDTAPHLPVAGASSVSAFNRKAQRDSSFSGNLITPHTMDLFSRKRTPRLHHPLGAQDAIAASRTTVFDRPRCLRTESGGEWKNDV